MSTAATQAEDDSAAERQAAALAELEARSDVVQPEIVVQHEIDDAERRAHPPLRPTFGDPNTDDAAFALDGAMPTEDEVRRAERLHEELSVDPIAETRDRVDAKDREVRRDRPGRGRSKLTNTGIP